MNLKKKNKNAITVLFITFIFCFFIFTGTLPAEKKITAEMRSIYNKIKSKADPVTLGKIKTAVANFKKEINLSLRGQDDLALAKRHSRIFSSRTGMDDVTRAAFIIMMEVTKDMNDDIQQILKELKVMAEAKNKLREYIEELNSWISSQMEKPEEDAIENKPVGNSRSNNKLAKMRITEFKKRPPLLKIKRRTPNFGIEYYIAPKIKKGGNYKNKSKPYLKKLYKNYVSDLKSLGGITRELSLKLQIAMERRQKIIQTLSNILKKISATNESLINNKK